MQSQIRYLTLAALLAAPMVASAAGLPSGYVNQGKLTWMPVNQMYPWDHARDYCPTFKGLGKTGWRQPTKTELQSLYSSGAMKGQGWKLYGTWSSSPSGMKNGEEWHYLIYLDDGAVESWGGTNSGLISCVHD